MRSFGFVLVVLLAGGCASLGTRSSDEAAQVIRSLEDDWIKGAVRRDSVFYDNLLAPTFIYTENDAVVTRAELLHAMTAGPDTVTSGRNEDLTVRVSGNTAIATGWLVLIGHNAKGPFEQHYRFTDTWQFLDGRWRVLAAQDYLKP